MAAKEAATGEDAPKKKGGKLGLVLGLVTALVLGGGGFYAVHSGLLLAPQDASESKTVGPALPLAGPLPGVAFVAVDPLVVNLGPAGAGRHLRFRAHLEVNAEHVADVTLMLPRVTDVLNGYLRAVDMTELSDPMALQRLRAQMLRRVQVVTGEGRVRDLLIMEFVLT